MITDIRGVLENGEPRASTVPASTGCNVSLTAGETATVRLYVTTPAGIPMDATGWTLRLYLRKAVSDTFAKAIVVGAVDASQGKGRWVFAVPADTTRKLVAGSFVFDVWAENVGGDRFPVVTISSLFVAPAVGRSQEA